MPATTTQTIPSTGSTNSIGTFFSKKSTFAAADIWPLSGMRIAAASMTAMT